VQILGDLFDGPGGGLDLPEGFDQPLPPQRSHRRDPERQAKDPTELAGADTERPREIVEREPQARIAVQAPADPVQTLDQESTCPGLHGITGRLIEHAIGGTSSNRVVKSLQQLGDRPPATR